jgi:hypothetical protein
VQIPPHQINNSLFSRPITPASRPNIVAPIQTNQTQNFRPITPQAHHYGAVSQLINSKYLFELKKDIKKVIRGRKLKEILDYDYSEEEFDNLPISLRNLISFDRTITTAEILQFMESFDKSHEITFRDYAFDRIKFRALYEALGELLDVEMQAGPSTFVSLNENFEIKKKIKEIFVDFKDRIKDKLKLKAKKNKTQISNNDDQHRQST